MEETKGERGLEQTRKRHVGRSREQQAHREAAQRLKPQKKRTLKGANEHKRSKPGTTRAPQKHTTRTFICSFALHVGRRRQACVQGTKYCTSSVVTEVVFSNRKSVKGGKSNVAAKASPFFSPPAAHKAGTALCKRADSAATSRG